ncbi:MAG TPA: hypothetical protein VHL57_10790, partial [Flavobacteriales bacterium]|nr:hypothetical protein [Flavobacteriales bacterium]
MKRSAWAFALCLPLLAGAQKVQLALHEGWTMGQEGTTQRWPAQVPGVVHTDLLRAGVIPDPFHDENVDNVQWIERADWVYERTVQVDEAVLRHGHVDLVFEGLDTYAEVYWNDVLLGRADNMFRRWTYPLKKLLRPGPARLKVIFRSPIAEGQKRRAAYGLQLPADNDAGSVKVSPYMRKAAYQFGWDFAPRLVTSGIWRPVALHCWDDVRVQDMHVRSRMDEAGNAWLDLQAVLVADRAISITLKAGTAGGIELESDLKLRGGRDTLHFQLPLPDALPWWPQGEGERPLYAVRLGGWKGQRLLFLEERQVGVRTIALDQSVDSIGAAF